MDNSTAEIRVSFEKYLKKWLRISKIHGLDRPVVSNRFIIRAIWIVCFLASASVCLFLNGRIITDFLRYEVKTRIREVYVESVAFPKVSVCNYNPFVTPQANEFLRGYFKEKFNITAKKYLDLFSHDFSPQTEMNYILYSINDPNFNATLKKSFGYEFILICKYYTDDCSRDDIIHYFDSTHANCYMINSNVYPNGSARTPNRAYLQDFGLQLIMFVGEPENETNYLFNVPIIDKKGMIIRIEDAEYDGVLLGGIGVSPGTQAEILLSRVETKNMPNPYSECMPAESVRTLAAEYMKKMNMTYNRKTCMYVCGQISNFNEIGCINLLYPILPEMPYCITQLDVNRLNQLNFDFSMCNEMCPIECDSVSYETSVSYTQWPTYNSWLNAKQNNVSKFLEKNMDFELVRKSFASVSIKFKNIKYTEITETPSMLFPDLVAAIGGMLGLFLGFSIMCIVEIVELGIEVLIFYCAGKLKQFPSLFRKIKPKISENQTN